MSEQLDCGRACILTLCPLTALPTSVLVALCKKPSRSEWAFWLALEAKLAGEGSLERHHGGPVVCRGLQSLLACYSLSSRVVVLRHF